MRALAVRIAPLAVLWLTGCPKAPSPVAPSAPAPSAPTPQKQAPGDTAPVGSSTSGEAFPTVWQCYAELHNFVITTETVTETTEPAARTTTRIVRTPWGPREAHERKLKVEVSVNGVPTQSYETTLRDDSPEALGPDLPADAPLEEIASLGAFPWHARHKHTEADGVTTDEWWVAHTPVPVKSVVQRAGVTSTTKLVSLENE